MLQELKTAFNRYSPSKLTELELFCNEKYKNLAISKCAKLVNIPLAK